MKARGETAYCGTEGANGESMNLSGTETLAGRISGERFLYCEATQEETPKYVIRR
jgi:hypothetical protein